MSLNKVILIGNVGRDPDVRYFDSGAPVPNFPLATTERGDTLANGTTIPERTDWHNIVVRRDQVQFVERYVRKGSLVYVEGKLRTRSYDDPSGVRRYVTEVHADRVEFYYTGSRPNPEGTAASPAQAGGSRPAAAPDPAYRQPTSPLPGISPESADAGDLPF